MKRVGKLTTRWHGDLLMVEYRGGELCNVVTTEGGYDVNTSKGWGRLYHNHGGGGCYLHAFAAASPGTRPQGAVWIADGVEVTDGSLASRVLSAKDIRAMGYRILRAPGGDPFEDAMECDIEWCDACEDHMPDEHLCEHLGHVPGAWVVGPGNLSDTREQIGEARMMLAVVEMVARAGIARQWRRLIAKGRLDWKYGLLGKIYTDDVEQICRGVIDDESVGEFAWVWFRGLDAKTPEANALTLEWLDAVIACQNERRAKGERMYRLKVYGDLEPRWYSWAEALHEARERRAKGERVRVVYVRRGLA